MNDERGDRRCSPPRPRPSLGADARRPDRAERGRRRLRLVRASRCPSTYARLGVHDPASTEPRRDLHASTFDVDERAIAIGVRVLVHATLAALTDPPDPTPTARLVSGDSRRALATRLAPKAG